MTRITALAALLLTAPAFAGGYVAPITDAPPCAARGRAGDGTA